MLAGRDQLCSRVLLNVSGIVQPRMESEKATMNKNDCHLETEITNDSAMHQISMDQNEPSLLGLSAGMDLF